jgi:nicotinamidase-related amidase
MKQKKRLIKKILLSLLAIILLSIAVVIVNFLVFQKMATVVSQGEPISHYDHPQAALVVIDIQEATTGTVSDNPYYQAKADKLIQNINLLAERFHKNGKPVIYVRSEISNPLLNLLNSSYAKGSPGAQFDKRLDHTSGIEVVKNRSDSFINTKLDSILTTHRVNEIYMAGLDAAHCVNLTTQAALNRNYKVHMIEDAVLTKSDALKDSMMVVFRDRGFQLVNMNDVDF